MWLWIYNISGWAVALVMAPMMARRYPVAKALGWLAVFFAVPWIGLMLFLVFGENPLGRRRIVRYRRVIQRLHGEDRLTALRQWLAGAKLDDSTAALARQAQACGAPPPVAGNEAQLLDDNAMTLRQLIADIDAATQHVHLVFYIYNDDEVGRQLGHALVRAARRGVTCRVVADSIGSRPFARKIAPWLRKHGVQVQMALPVNPLRGQMSRFDLRNHRKIGVIDGRVGYIGSWNAALPLYHPKRVGPYEDVMLRLQGPVVLQMQVLFLEDWSFETADELQGQGLFPQPQEAGNVIAQAVPSGPLYPYSAVRDLAVSAINRATRRLVMTTPYFVPDEELILALRLASQRGVEVNIILPAETDSRFVDAAARSYARDLLAVNVRVYHHSGTFLHAKILTCDSDVSIVGSANLDIRSFRLDIESTLMVYSPQLTQSLIALQERYMEKSVRLNLADRRKRPYLRRTWDDLAKLLSPLM